MREPTLLPLLMFAERWYLLLMLNCNGDSFSTDHYQWYMFVIASLFSNCMYLKNISHLLLEIYRRQAVFIPKIMVFPTAICSIAVIVKTCFFAYISLLYFSRLYELKFVNCIYLSEQQMEEI